ncbi:MAG: MarR family transcriptional regulator [Pseudohongiellaceae bacterium]
MSSEPVSKTDEVIVALRRVIRAIELHSRALVSSHGMTGPQAAVLRALTAKPITAGALAKDVNLSQGTVTDILNRLEHKGLLTRQRDSGDRRRVIVQLTDKAQDLLRSAPPLLQESFSRRFNQLADWEQSLLLTSLQRIAHMMDADEKQPLPMHGYTAGSVADESTSESIPVSV